MLYILKCSKLSKQITGRRETYLTKQMHVYSLLKISFEKKDDQSSLFVKETYSNLISIVYKRPIRSQPVANLGQLTVKIQSILGIW